MRKLESEWGYIVITFSAFAAGNTHFWTTGYILLRTTSTLHIHEAKLLDEDFNPLIRSAIDLWIIPLSPFSQVAARTLPTAF